MPSTPTNVSASDGAYRDGILVTWSYSGNLSEVSRWDVYRWKDSETPKFYYSVFGNTLQYSDFLNVFGFSQDVTAKYNYAVRAYSYTTGSSELSQADSGFIAPNNAPTFSSSSLSVSTNEDQSKQISLVASDKDGDTLTYAITKSASNGSLKISGSSATYTPTANFNGSDTFTVKVSDAWGGSSTQVINVTVNPVNDNPIFLSNAISQNSKLIAKASGSTIFKISAFELDAGDRVTYSVGSATSGQVSISGNTITYTPAGNATKSDSFEVTASDGNGGVTKQKIDVVIGTPATPSSSLLPMSGSDTIDMMLNGYRWYGDTIYYSFSVGADGNSIPTDPVKFEQDLKFIFETAFGVYLDIKFEFVGFFESPEYAYYSGSNINIALDRTNFSSPNILGRANFPVLNTPLSTFPSSYLGSEGDVFININGPANTLTYAPGTEGFLLLIHEIGHALGLKHPHDDGESGRPTFSDLKLSGLNIDWWTIMSYKDDSNSLYYWDPTTPMVLDVIALQYLYGSSNNAAGNNVYDIRFNLPAYFTIFDSAGSDVLDFRNAAEAVYVELLTLWISSFQKYPIGIAAPLSDFNRAAPSYLTWLYGNFEELQGSSYSDRIIGSQNTDTIFGNAGNDAIRGGRGSDSIDGGSGTDTVFFADLFSECTVTFDGDQCVVTTRTEGTDRLVNVEKLSFGPTGSAVEYTVASLNNRNPAFATSSQATSTTEDAAKTITVSATDADGDRLTYTVSRTPTNGTTTISGSNVTYTPKANYNGSDSFVVTASDGRGGTATQTVNVTVSAVNDAPTFLSASQSVSTTAGTAKNITLVASDVDGDALTYTVATPSKGSATISGSTLTYTPTASASGTDSFVVTASDGKGGTATQTINATLEAATTTTSSADFRVTATDGWTGAIGGNGLVFGTSGYQDIKVLSGTVTFDASFNKGGDILRFDMAASSYTVARAGSSAQINAGANLSAIIPVGTAGMVTSFSDGVRKLLFSGGNFTLGAQTFSTSPANISSAADGTSLPTGASSGAGARITLAGNDLRSNQTSHITIGGKGTIFGNAFKSDVVAIAAGVNVDLFFDASFNRGGDTIILDKSAASYSAIRTGASIILTSINQTLTIPVGTSSTTIKFADGSRALVYSTTELAIKLGTQVIATTTTAITPLNRSPAFSASSQAVLTNEDTAKTITVSATDPDGDRLTYSVSTAAGKGTTSLSGNSIIYTPNANYNGADSFVVTVNDGKGGTAIQTVNVTVSPVDETVSIDVVDDRTATTYSAVGDIYHFTDNSSQKTNAIITGMTPGDTVDVTSASSDYSFTSVGTDIRITYNNTAAGVLNVIVLKGIAGTGFISDETSAEASAGWNFFRSAQASESSATASLDVGTATSTATVSAAGAAFTLTDDAKKSSYVKITSFAAGDSIRITGAAEGQYSFSSSDLDRDGSADDLSISYSDAGLGVVNDIQILSVVSPTAFIFDRATAVSAVGFNFITFG